MSKTLFDKTSTFNRRIAPIINRLNAIAAEEQVPLVTIVTLVGIQNGENTDFSILASVGGMFFAMPIEQMIAAAVVSPEFMEALREAHSRFLLALITMPPAHAESEQYRADFRGAVAFVAARNLVERSKETLRYEADSVRSMSGFFQAMMGEAIARTEHPELYAGEDNDESPLPAEYTDFINSLFKGKGNG